MVYRTRITGLDKISLSDELPVGRSEGYRSYVAIICNTIKPTLLKFTDSQGVIMGFRGRPTRQAVNFAIGFASLSCG